MNGAVIGQAQERLRVGWAPILLGVALLVPLALVASFHCDEANVLRHVTEFGLGDYHMPGRPGLLWLLLTPALRLGDPVAIAIATRLLAVGASTVTLWAVWRLALRASDPTSAMAAVALLATSMSWQAHAFEVRTDTFVLPLTLLTMLLLWRAESRVREAVLVGLLVAGAGLFSQKSIYNAGAIGAGWLVLVALRQLPRRLVVPAVASAVALGCVAAWYGFLHEVNSGSDAVSTNLTAAASNAFDKPRSLKINLGAWAKAFDRAPLLYLGLIPGVVVALRRMRENGQLAAMVAASLVMGSTIFYHRGFYMYFIASFEPYLAVVAGAGLVALMRGLPGPPRVRTGAGAAVVVVAVGICALWYPAMLTTSNRQQLQVMRDVAETFPEPVPYWDSVGLIPGYPETTMFLTRANRERLRRERGDGALLQIARERKPLALIRNYMTRERYLEEVERAWVWAHFVPYRSNFYLRGGRLRVRAGEGKVATVEVVEGGPYTVYFWGGWRGEATVDGQPVQHGEVIDLAPGDVDLVAHAVRGSGQLWIMLGRDRRPQAETIDDVIDWSLYPLLSRRRYQQYDKPNRDADLLTQLSDPVLQAQLPLREIPRRRRAHATWQQVHDAAMAKIQEQANEQRLPATDPLSPAQEGEDVLPHDEESPPREDAPKNTLPSPEERESQATQPQ